MTLSDKIQDDDDRIDVILEVQDVKKFIKETLKLIEGKFSKAETSIMGCGWYKAQAESLVEEIKDKAGGSLI